MYFSHRSHSFGCAILGGILTPSKMSDVVVSFHYKLVPRSLTSTQVYCSWQNWGRRCPHAGSLLAPFPRLMTLFQWPVLRYRARSHLLSSILAHVCLPILMADLQLRATDFFRVKQLPAVQPTAQDRRSLGHVGSGCTTTRRPRVLSSVAISLTSVFCQLPALQCLRI